MLIVLISSIFFSYSFLSSNKLGVILDKKNSEINLLKKIGNYYKLRYGRSIMFGDFSYTILKFGEFLKL